MTGRRDDLLSRVVKAAAEGGLARRSLRDLAAQVGTSHRMLIHHFGSREGLLTAVVEAVERDQNERLGELPADAAAAIRVSWRRTSVPTLWPIERLFFECYARGAQGERPFNRLVPALGAAHPRRTTCARTLKTLEIAYHTNLKRVAVERFGSGDWESWTLKGSGTVAQSV